MSVNEELIELKKIRHLLEIIAGALDANIENLVKYKSLKDVK